MKLNSNRFKQLLDIKDSHEEIDLTMSKEEMIKEIETKINRKEEKRNRKFEKKRNKVKKK